MSSPNQRTASLTQQIAAESVQRLGAIHIGHHDDLALLVLTTLAGGHAILEEMPGSGKTVLTRNYAHLCGLDYGRIQGVADLLPGDITGISVYLPDTHAFQFRPGPVFHRFIHLDELNRIPEKAQSALLEALQEGQVTNDGVAYPLPRPYRAVATQNPAEIAGTFPLSLALADRFMTQISFAKLTRDEKLALLALRSRKDAAPRPAASVAPGTAENGLHPSITIGAPLPTWDWEQVRAEIAATDVDRANEGYMADLVIATENHPALKGGVSNRALGDLLIMSQAWARFMGSGYVRPDDVQKVFPYVMGHRYVFRSRAALRQQAIAAVNEQIINELVAPPGSTYSALAVGQGRR